MKNSEKKERYESVTMEFSSPERINSFSVDENGNIKMFCDGEEKKPKTIHFERGIERKNKNKIIFSSQIDIPNTGIYTELLYYDYLVALDTNYDISDAIAVGKVYRISNSSSKFKFQLVPVSNLKKVFSRNHNISISPELVALQSLIAFFLAGKIIKDFSNSRIMIIIDHNLDKLDLYNSKQCPLIEGNEDTYLPDNIRLIYASADKYNDSIFNQIIKECDKEANDIRKKGKLSNA